MSVHITGSSTSDPGKMFMLKVKPNASNSRKPGRRRSAPSAKPMYQSGCEPAVMGEGSYGP